MLRSATEYQGLLALLMVFTAALSAIGLGLAGLIRRSPNQRWAAPLGATLLFALFGIAILDGQAHLLGGSELPHWSLIGAICVLGWLTYWAPVRRVLEARPALLSTLLLSGGVLMCGELSRRLVGDYARESELAALDASLVPVAGTDVRTDRGTPLTLFTSSRATPPSADLVRALKPNTATSCTAMQIAPPDLRYNCHGWVFTQGAYVVRADALVRILDENSYERVDEPRAGDVIIYFRAEDGLILHSGIVRSTAADGVMLIESKWAALGRFLHTPDAQPFSQHYRCYRSARRGHVLVGLHRDGPQDSMTASPAGSNLLGPIRKLSAN